jgi:poly(A) polymerase
MELPIRKEVLDTLKSLNGEIYIVGGTVRDILLKKPQNDIDLVVIKGGYEKTAKRIANILKSPMACFKDNIRIDCGEYHIDVSAPRGATIEEDLLKRDFTVNNLALGVDGTLYGDTNDLNNRVITPVHELVFSDDPIRILRGFRLALTLDFSLSDGFIKLAVIYAAELKKAAVERVFNEFRQIAFAKPNVDIYEKMSAVGVWKTIIGTEPDIELLTNTVALINNKHYRSDCLSFALFLATLLVNADRMNIKKFKLSRNEEHAVSELLAAKRVILKAETDDEFKRIIWRLHTLGLAEAATDFVRLAVGGNLFNTYTSILNHFSPSLADAVNGADIADIAPQRRGGAWISETLATVKIALAFKDISEREKAINLAKELINSYR